VREMDFHSLEPAQRVKGARPLSVDGSPFRWESLKQIGGHPQYVGTGFSAVILTRQGGA